MNRALACFAVSGVAFGVFLATVGQAHADTFYPYGSKGDNDTGLYEQELLEHGIGGNMVTAAQLSASVCTKLHDGYSEDQVISLAAEATNTRMAKIAVWGAEWHFCPRYY